MKRTKRLKVKCKNLVRKDNTSIMNVRKRIKTFEDALFCLDENDELKLLYRLQKIMFLTDKRLSHMLNCAL